MAKKTCPNETITVQLHNKHVPRGKERPRHLSVWSPKTTPYKVHFLSYSVFIELLVYIELTKKLICTCSPTLVLTKGTKAHQRKVSSARLIVYTAHFIRAGLDFQDRVPVLSMLRLPLDMVQARVKFWSGMDRPKLFTRLNVSLPNQFFWYTYVFHPSRAKNFRLCKWGLKLSFLH